MESTGGNLPSQSVPAGNFSTSPGNFYHQENGVSALFSMPHLVPSTLYLLKEARLLFLIHLHELQLSLLQTLQ